MAPVHLGALQKNLPLVRLMSHDCPYFFHEMKNTSLFFVYGKFKTSLLFLANKRGKAYHAAMHLQLNQAIYVV